VTDGRVCVVLPTFNESKNIINLIEAIFDACPARYDLEIVVVDDNSPDRTYDHVCDTFGDDPRVSALLRTSDRGLARSIRDGIVQSTAEYIVVMDTDFTHDPKEIPNLLHVLEICDIVSGSRFCAGGRMSDLQHYAASLLYNWILRILLRTQIQDNSGGFFAARRANLVSLPLDDIFFGYGDYFFRLLYFAQRAKMKVIEIPAEYLSRSQGETKSNWFKMLVMYTSAAVRLRLKTWSKRRTLFSAPRQSREREEER
jgi:dolichol-phosphate mannosyltransferase